VFFTLANLSAMPDVCTCRSRKTGALAGIIFLELFLAGMFTQIGPVWVGDLGLTKRKNLNGFTLNIAFCILKLEIRPQTLKNLLTRPKN
jgi:hypothetical protein